MTDIDQELASAIQAMSKARKILRDYMAKPGATLEGDIFSPTVVAIVSAVLDAEPIIAKREREKVLRHMMEAYARRVYDQDVNKFLREYAREQGVDLT